MPQELVIPIVARYDSETILHAIDMAAIEIGLSVTLRAELKSFPGSTHWHVKQGRQPGTLEITWWPKERKMWIKVQAGRTAPWIDEIAPRLKRKIESHLRRADRQKNWTEKELL
ncbi:MAG: hypothetical protein ABSH22_03285 [Tepidisphaeraceae bacterium]